MSRIVLCLLCTICTSSFAQTSRDWIYEQQRATGTNTKYAARRTSNPETKREEQSIEELEGILVETFITPPAQELNNVVCDAEISLEYSQMDDKVQVDAHISNQQCASSFGNYEIRVSTRDRFGERHQSSHLESWRLDNASQNKVALMYDIGNDVELISARIRGNAKDFCTCVTEQSEADDTEDSKE